MDKQTLIERLNKQLEKKEKIEKKLALFASKLTEEEKEFAITASWTKLRDYGTYDKYLDLDNYRRKYFELREINRTIENTQEKITKIKNFENETKIEVLVNFLNDWKEKAHDWYLENYALYREKRNNYNKVFEEYKLANIEIWNNCTTYNGRWYFEKEFKDNYYLYIAGLTKRLAEYGSYEFETRLNKYLEEEVTRKYKDLVSRISSVVGEIKDVSDLSIGEQNGEINGIIVGTKCKAKVETISAGGYNIQCFHYRVLVHKVK